MVTVDVRVDSVQSLEELTDRRLEVLGEGGSDARREYGFVVDVGLHPAHQVLDVFGCGHLGWFGIAGLGVLPEVFESKRETWLVVVGKGVGKVVSYSSVAFISGHDCGEQNSVIDP